MRHSWIGRDPIPCPVATGCLRTVLTAVGALHEGDGRKIVGAMHYPKSIARASRAELLGLVGKYEWYHRIDLGEVVAPGPFDIGKVIGRYGFPDTMMGLRVLDVGRSSGYFAFEFERRGAQVVATELPPSGSKDFVGGAFTDELLRRWVRREYDHANATPEQRDEIGIRHDFFIAHKLLGSKVEPVYASFADLSPESLGCFDLVFIGSVLNHTRDPAGALQTALSVTKPGGRLIVANPIDAIDNSPEPRLRFVGMAAPNLTTWLLPNVAALAQLIRSAGFLDIRIHDAELVLATENGGTRIPHAVVHARRGDDQEIRREMASVLKRKYRGIEELA
jgi:tRNA (mo5U34)-methyltransferase